MKHSNQNPQNQKPGFSGTPLDSRNTTAGKPQQTTGGQSGGFTKGTPAQQGTGGMGTQKTTPGNWQQNQNKDKQVSGGFNPKDKNRKKDQDNR